MPLFASFLAGTALFYLFGFFPFSSIILFFSSSAYLLKKRKAILILVIIAGFLNAFTRTPGTEDLSLANRDIVASGRFMPETGQENSDYNRRFIVDKAVDRESGEEIDELDDRKILISTDEDFATDKSYDLLIRTGKDKKRLNPGSPTQTSVYARLIGMQGQPEEAHATIYIFDKVRGRIAQHISKSFDKDTAAFISAITVGIYGLDERLKDAFSITGLAHILSISGTHFGIFSFLVFTISLVLIKKLPNSLLQRLTLYLTPSQAAAAVSLPLMAFYLGISGGSVPAVRSFIMITLFLFGLLIGRKGQWLNTIFFAAFLLAIWTPKVILDLSFQLSFIAVLFIGFAVEDKTYKQTGPKNRIKRYMIESIRLTLAASLGTAPLVAYHFHYFSLISPLSNLIIAPIIGFIIIPLALLSSISFLLTGVYLFSTFIDITTGIALALVNLMSNIPYADLKIAAFPVGVLIFFYLGFIPYLLFGRAKRLLVIPVIPLILYAAAFSLSPRHLSVTFLDVGQGDSAVVELPDNRTIVIDTGRTGRETSDHLKYLGKRDIDALVLTHAHPDHTGGLDTLLRRFRVKELWDNGYMEYFEYATLPPVHRQLRRGDMTIGKGYSITALHPYHEFHTLEDNEFIEENNSSLVLKITADKSSIILLGDIEDEAAEDIQHLGKWIQGDLVKIPHHGGRSSAHEGLFRNISPSSAVISVGRSNSFGHPSSEMLELIADNAIYRTDTDGAVKAEETTDGLKVKTFREMQIEQTQTITGELRNLRRLFSTW